MVVWEESTRTHPILIPSEQGGIPRPQLTLSLDDNLTCKELCSIHSQLKEQLIGQEPSNFRMQRHRDGISLAGMSLSYESDL